MCFRPQYQCSRWHGYPAVSHKPAVEHSIDFLVSNRTNASLRRLKMTVIIVNMLLRRNIYLDLLYNGAKMIDWLLCLLESCRLRLKSSNVCLSRSSVSVPAAAKELRAEGGISNTGNRHFRAQPREHANKKKGKSSSSGLVFLLLRSRGRTRRLQGC